ncbi:hypothetical protein GCM10010149_40940 [Nonomuraea roseoviolacea subsp. roseoviolacea]
MEPTRAVLRKAITDMLDGHRTREDVASWAERSMLELEDAVISDPVIWDSLQTLSGADLKDGPDSYLHNAEDLRSWMAELD